MTISTYAQRCDTCKRVELLKASGGAWAAKKLLRMGWKRLQRVPGTIDTIYWLCPSCAEQQTAATDVKVSEAT